MATKSITRSIIVNEKQYNEAKKNNEKKESYEFDFSKVNKANPEQIKDIVIHILKG